jgi:hypothetical protein
MKGQWWISRARVLAIAGVTQVFQQADFGGMRLPETQPANDLRQGSEITRPPPFWSRPTADVAF